MPICEAGHRADMFTPKTKFSTPSLPNPFSILPDDRESEPGKPSVSEVSHVFAELNSALAHPLCFLNRNLPVRCV